ncbi:MAG: DUF4373 domain-containing protein [Muribaculum sp.]|nr:DUF4373 domain-containing protein [Muribaculum sp.]
MANTNLQVYFPHNAYAHTSTKLYRMRLELGTLAYGVYYILLERLRLEENYRSELDEVTLCHDCGCDTELLYQIIHNYKLFEVYREEEGGTVYFESIELNAHIRFMEEKKAKRRRDAQAAALARWGKNAEENVSSEIPSKNTVTEANDIESNEAQRIPVEPEILPIDKEIQTMKEDSVWISSISDEFDRSVLEVENVFPLFREECIRNGKKGGHKDLEDVMRHFRSWLKTSCILVKPDSKNAKKTQVCNSATQREIKRREESDRRQELRNAEYKKQQENKTTPNDYIRNKGYDPEKVTMVMLMKPGWQENNPPTHPEWIGRFGKKETEEFTNNV